MELDRSVDNLLGGSLTEGWRALDFFTDRFAAVRRFAEYLNDDPAPASVLFFHGNGGNGKSLLVRYLRNRCCKRLSAEDWDYFATLPDDDLAAGLDAAEDATAIPSVAIDFGLGTEDVVGTLQELRRGLAPHGFKFPLFTYACVQYWQQAGELSQEQLRRVLPDDDLSFAVDIADALAEAVPFGSLVFTVMRLAGSHFGPWFDRYRLRRGLDAALLETIGRLDYRTELVQNLPILFAEDLNTGMDLPGAPPRVVLCFDTYERFWGDERAVDARRRFDRDAWFRRLLTSVDRTAGIVTVVAGREPPGWEEVPDVKVGGVELVEVGDFADADARDYLQRTVGEHQELQGRLLDLARAGPDRVHPFLLGLVVDVVEAAERAAAEPVWDELLAGPQIADKAALLVHRFLRYVDDETAYAVRALAACRSFDFATYRFLGAERGFEATRPRFEALVRFSFVRSLPGTEEPGYRLHDLLRRLLSDHQDTETLAAHAALERWDRERGAADATAAAEAIYHANRVDAVRGIDEWSWAMERELRAGRLDRCRALVGVADDFVVPSVEWRGRRAYWIGQYALVLADYPRSEAEFGRALGAYDAAIAETPDDAGRWRRKGVIFNSLGRLLQRVGRYEDARRAFEEGVASLDEALRRDPAEAESHNVRGALLQSLGDLLVARGAGDEAEAALRASVAAFEEASAIEPDSAAVWNNTGGTYLELAKLLISGHRFGEAVDALGTAVDAFDRALDLVPDHVPAATNRAIALSTLGDIHAELGRSDDAIVAYRDSVSGYDDVTAVSPDSVPVYLNKGETLQSLGEFLLKIGKIADAAGAFRDAAAAQDEVLARAPHSSTAQANKGEHLASLAEAQAAFGDVAAAIESVRAGVSAFDAALSVAPELVDALVGKANALMVTAELLGGEESRPSVDSGAVRREARLLSERASALAPDREDVRLLIDRLHRTGGA